MPGIRWTDPATRAMALLIAEQVPRLQGYAWAHVSNAKPIFRTQQVERETLAGLRFFFDAAQREIATVELARRVLKFLHRAQHDPELKFAL